MDNLARFDQGMGVGMPEDITVHLDAGYDSAKTRGLLTQLGCRGVISTKGFPLQAGKRWVAERTNSWHNHGIQKLATCTDRRARVIDAFIAARERRHHHPPTPRRSLAHPPVGWASRPTRRPSPICGTS